jgi:uridine kinase
MGGRQDAFPYGYAMYAPLLLMFLFFKVLHVSMSLVIPSVLLIFDGLNLFILGKLNAAAKRNIAGWLYATSPLVLYISFVHGQLDLIPTSLLLISFFLLLESRWSWAGLFLAFAVSAKLSIFLIIPFLFIFFLDNPRYRAGFQRSSYALLSGILLLSVMPLTFSGYHSMVLSTPETLKIFDYFLPLNSHVKLFLSPMLVMLLLIWLWRIGRSTTLLLVVFSSASLFLLALLTPGSIGWYLWSIPVICLTLVRDRRATIWIFLASQMSILLSHLDRITRLKSNPLQFSVSFTQSWFDPNSKFSNIIVSMSIALGFVLIGLLLSNIVTTSDPYRLGLKPLSIAIAGDSGAGKDTLMNELTQSFETNTVTAILGDDYHLFERHNPNWNVLTHLDPFANDLNRMDLDLRRSLERKDVFTSHYDHSLGRFTNVHKLKGGDLILVNGLHSLTLTSVKSDVDLKVFLEIEDVLRSTLKIGRDASERNQSPEDVWLNIQKRKNDSDKYIANQKAISDLYVSIHSTNPSSAHEKYFVIGIGFRNFTFISSLLRVIESSMTLRLSSLTFRDDFTILQFIDVEQIDHRELAILAYRLIPDINLLISNGPKFSNGSRGLISLVTYVALAEKRLVRGIK